METNRIIVYLSLIAIAILLVVPTVTKINNDHLNKSYLVATKQIEEAATNCYYKKDCKDTKITLDELIEKDYLSSIINPKTEEYFSGKSYVIVDISSDTSKLHAY